MGEKARNNKTKKKNSALIISITLLAVALIITTVTLVIRKVQNDRIMNNTLVLKGVSVNGIDISEMTKAQAYSATADIENSLLEKIVIPIDFDGEILTFNAADFGITTDYDEIIAQAVAFGHTGPLEERKHALKVAESQGVKYTVTLAADREKVTELLTPLKAKYDIAPIEATMEFMPWGYLPDGTAYQPDKQQLIKDCAAGKTPQMPELVRFSEDQMPNKLRYLFWKNTKYIDGYIPADANIERFKYTEHVIGRSIDIESVIKECMDKLQNGDYTAITAPVQVLEPVAKIEDLKQKTQLITSWTSSFSNHYNYNRNWNVAKLSGIINGVIIEPGTVWSINDEAGVRTVSAGWLEAAGILNGGYVPQAGGGVCQISSTLYNAAIRANLEITDSTHHSIQSDYIPLGLDATISSGAPDLKIKNQYDTPVYIVSYVNPKDKNVTVEIYGQTVKDPELGDVILNFSFKDGGTFGTPTMRYVYNTAIAPDQTIIAPGESYEYAKNRYGRTVETFIHYLDLNGNELKVESFHNYKWNPFNGMTYVNAPDPATITLPEYTSPPFGYPTW